MPEQKFMERAIELAQKGSGWTNPNPLVGAVIVKNNRIIGEGYHKRYGELHAERNAFQSLTESAEGAELYVTLEPCCHHGKTPPCTEAIIEHKISHVIIGSTDPNPLVAGKGIAQLKKAGIAVTVGYLKEECDSMNRIFFHHITTKLPYVIAKYAMTADGKTATRTGASKWITGEEARNHVQQLRSKCMAIMAGIGTVLADNPLLTVRLEGYKSPIRIICDSHLRIPLESQICKTAQTYPTIMACAHADAGKRESLTKLGIEVIEVPDENGQVDLTKLFQILGQEKGIDSVFLEGGGTLTEYAFRHHLIQELQVFIAPKIFGSAVAKSPVGGLGVEEPDDAYTLQLVEHQRIGEDLWLSYLVKNKERRNSCLQES